MAIDIFNIQPNVVSRDLKGYSTLVYGPPKVGKTTFAARHPKSLLLGWEKGFSTIPGIRAIPINTWAEFIQVLGQLKKDSASVKLSQQKGGDASTMYDTIIIDVADIAYDACEKYILNREGVDKVSAIPYGGGYGMIEKEFDERMRSIVQMGYGLILISHATFMQPEDEGGIRKATPTLSKRPKKICSRLVDNYVYISMEETADGIERIMHFRETPEWEAGSRFRYMPESCKLGFKEYKQAINEAIERLEQEEGAEYFTSESQNNFELAPLPSFDETVSKINKHINDLMTSCESDAAQEKMYVRISGIIENYLGQGKKLADATEKQIEQIIIIEEALEDLLKD